MDYEKVVYDALACFESRMKFTDERLRKDIDNHCYSWSIIADQKYYDFHYCLGMSAMLRFLFPPELVKNETFAMRLEHLFDHSLADLRDYYYSHLSPLPIDEVKQ